MSTSPKPEDVPKPDTRPNVERAGHVGREFDEVERLCVETVRTTRALRYLAHYTGNVFNFGADMLDEAPHRSDRPPGTTGRDELCRVGRSLCFVLARQDATLLEARTGALIRLVLQTTTGAAYCNVVVPGESVVGFALDDGTIEHTEPFSTISGQRSADIAMASVVTRIRQRVGLPSSNPGGWRTGQPSSAAAEAGSVTMSAHSTKFTTMSEESRRVQSACSAAVHPTTVQAIAYCARGEIMFMVDCLDDESLLPFFTQVTADVRRKFYLEHAREIGGLAVTLGRTVHTALGGGPVLRIVLDIEQGAIYYYRLRAGDYLVGVTLNQSRVSPADDRMAVLTRDVMKTIAS